MENEIQQNIPPVQPVTQNPVSPSTNWSKTLLFTVLGLVIVAGSVFVGIQIGINKISTQQPITQQPVISPTQTVVSPTTATEKPGAEKNNINFTKIGTLQNCSSYASDLPYNNNCWGLAYTSNSGKTLTHTTLKFNSNSYCNFGQGDELCLSSKIESYYKSTFGQNKKINIEGSYDPSINQLITVVKLTVIQ